MFEPNFGIVLHHNGIVETIRNLFVFENLSHILWFYSNKYDLLIEEVFIEFLVVFDNVINFQASAFRSNNFDSQSLQHGYIYLFKMFSSHNTYISRLFLWWSNWFLSRFNNVWSYLHLFYYFTKGYIFRV